MHGTIWLDNSIVAGNTAGATGYTVNADIKRLTGSSTGSLFGSYNLVGYDPDTTDGINNGVNGNQVGGESGAAAIDPGLAPLANYGGTTRTQVLLSGSLAIDAGDPSFSSSSLPLDQRGLTRVVGSRVDIGATEWSQPVLTDTNLSHAMPHGLGDSGVPVSYLLSGASDADSNVSLGIAIVGSDELRGVIQYSTDGGSTWQNVGSVSPANALLLSGSSNNRVRLVPNSPFVDIVADAITFQAWDQSIGASGQKLDLSTDPDGVSPGSNTLAISMLPASATGFVVNSTYQTGNQTQPAVATNAAGNSVIVWTGPGPSGTGVYAQLLAAGSNTAGAPILVATPTAGAAIQTPQVAIDSAGNFVVTWADTYGIYGRYFQADGTPKTNAFMVAVVLDPGSQYFQSPSVAMDNSGDVVFVWVDSYSEILYSRNYQISTSGSIIAADPAALQTATDSTGPNSWATVAEGQNGNYYVAWVEDIDNDDGTENSDIYVQEFDVSGTAQADPMLVSDNSDMWNSLAPIILVRLSMGCLSTACTWRLMAAGIRSSPGTVTCKVRTPQVVAGRPFRSCTKQ